MLRVEEELHATGRLSVGEVERVRWVVGSGANGRRGEGARAEVGSKGRRDYVARGWAQRRLVVSVVGHGEALNVVAQCSRVKVVHRHCDQRARRQRDRCAKLRASIAFAVGDLVCPEALVFRKNSCSKARASCSVAFRNLSLGAHAIAHLAALHCGARASGGNAQVNVVIALEVDRRKLPIQLVPARIVRRIVGPIRQNEIQVYRNAVGSVDGANVDVANALLPGRVSRPAGGCERAMAAEVRVEDLGVLEVKRDAGSDARRDWRWRRGRGRQERWR